MGALACLVGLGKEEQDAVDRKGLTETKTNHNLTTN
jgi:hypothetical protein